MREAVRRLRSLLGLGRTRSVEDFERMFRQFRSVLDGNNRSLEIITEMGEVLGGDYLFDVEYVRRARAALAEAVGRSVRAFDELTVGRYRKLSGVVASIDAMIGRVVDETPPAATELALLLEDVTPDRAPAVGGKAAHLSVLRAVAGLAVPDGFAVTTRAFDAFVRHNRLGSRIHGAGGEGATPPAVLRELVLHGEIPPELGTEIERALAKLRARCAPGTLVSVRSSAEDEDGERSYAGQFETVLNVPPERRAVEEAYRRVVASLFSARALAYQRSLGDGPRATKMAVACMAMVDAAVSGVLYTSNPLGGDTMVLDASWGLGTSVVDGRAEADHLVVRKDGTGAVVEERIGAKAVMTVPREAGGTEERETPRESRGRRSLDDAQLARLVDAGTAIERHFRSPQDVEWAFDRSGRLFVLQARPLRIQEDAGAPRPAPAPPPTAPFRFRSGGTVVQEGSAGGRVHVLRSPRDLDAVPRGAVLVARRDASDLVRVMPLVAAIVTDTGAPTSHMASLCREFRIPTIVNTGDATRVVSPGQEVTVIAAREGAAVYPGLFAPALAQGADRSARVEDLHEFRRRRWVLRLIAPLNLVDPLRDDFSPEACRTIHDVLRFMHEKAVARLVEGAGLGTGARRAVRLELSIPAGISVIDIGGGLDVPPGARRTTLDHVTSRPLRALVQGMTHPGVWRSEAVPLTTGDFVTSMLSAPDILAPGARFTGKNVAVVSREYANVHVKFGYHYTIVDCYCSDTPRNNHVTFRFAGGATDITKRTLRLDFIARVLEEHGFNVAVNGDLIVGRLANVRCEDLLGTLDQLGRLLAYTRQLDAVLRDGGDVGRLASSFLSGEYELG